MMMMMNLHQLFPSSSLWWAFTPLRIRMLLVDKKTYLFSKENEKKTTTERRKRRRRRKGRKSVRQKAKMMQNCFVDHFRVSPRREDTSSVWNAWLSQREKERGIGNCGIWGNVDRATRRRKSWEMFADDPTGCEAMLVSSSVAYIGWLFSVFFKGFPIIFPLHSIALNYSTRETQCSASAESA